MTTFSLRPERLDIKRAHAHVPTQPSPLRERFDADDLIAPDLDPNLDPDAEPDYIGAGEPGPPSSPPPPPNPHRITLRIRLPLAPPPDPVPAHTHEPHVSDDTNTHNSPHEENSLVVNNESHSTSTSTSTSPPLSPRRALSEGRDQIHDSHPSNCSSPAFSTFSDADTDRDGMRAQWEDDPLRRPWSSHPSQSSTLPTPRSANPLSPTSPQVFTYHPYRPAEDSATAKAAAAHKNREFANSFAFRDPTHPRSRHAHAHLDHLSARLRQFEARRADLLATVQILELQHRQRVQEEEDARAGARREMERFGQMSAATEAEVEMRARLRRWSEDDLAYDRYYLGKVEGDIRKWERFMGEIGRGEVCTRPRLRAQSSECVLGSVLMGRNGVEAGSRGGPGE